MAKSNKMPRILEEKHMGAELPVGATVTNLIDALNHYNYFYNRQDAIKFLDAYMKKNMTSLYGKRDLSGITTSVGWVARMLTRDIVLPAETVAWFTKKVSELPVLLKVVPVEEGKKLPINDDKYSLILARLEELFDEGSDINLTFLKDARLTKEELSNIVRFYNRRLFEIEKIGSDDQITEAYSVFTKKEIVAMKTFLNKVINFASELRYPEKLQEKEKSERKFVSSIKDIELLPADETTKVKSLDKTEMKQKKVLVLYIPGVRYLRVFIAQEGKKLEFDGIRVVNYDESKSFMKVIRNPEKDLANLKNKQFLKFWSAVEGITTKRVPLTTNKITKGNHILLGVYE